MAYNLTTFINQTNTTADIITNINNESGGFFAAGLLLLIWIISFIGSKGFETRIALLVSSVFTTFLAILFWWALWIPFVWIFIPGIFLFVSLVWNALS